MKLTRFDAIDAPESAQFCFDCGGKPHRCGQKSALALTDMIGRSTITCRTKVLDRYSRAIAICFKGGTNLNAWMVTQGWAFAFRRYGSDYVFHEDDARLNRRGMWAGSYEMPWDWRAKRR